MQRKHGIKTHFLLRQGYDMGIAGEGFFNSLTVKPGTRSCWQTVLTHLDFALLMMTMATSLYTTVL